MELNERIRDLKRRKRYVKALWISIPIWIISIFTYNFWLSLIGVLAFLASCGLLTHIVGLADFNGLLLWLQKRLLELLKKLNRPNAKP